MGFTEAQTKRVRAIAQDYVNRHHGGKVLPAALAIGVAQPTLYDFLRGGGLGSRMLEALCAKLERTRDDLLDGAADVRVERDRVPVVPPDDYDSPLEQALDAAFDPARHKYKDAESVRRAMRDGFQSQATEGDLIEAARRWLDAAADLRKRAVPITTAALAQRLSDGPKPMQHEIEAFESRKEQMRKEIEAEMRTHGVEPGQAKELGQAIVEKMRKLLPKRPDDMT